MLFPIDDTNTMFYWVALHETKGIPQDEWRKFCAAEVGVDLDRDFRKVRTLENRFLQDREAMKRGDFTGIKGIPAQDMAMWESMGPITDRSEDNLGSSDIAVIQFRRQMIAAAQALPRRRSRHRHDGAAHSVRRSSPPSKASCRNPPIGARSASRPMRPRPRASRPRRPPELERRQSRDASNTIWS